MTVKDFNEKLNESVRRAEQDKLDKFEEFLLDMEAGFSGDPPNTDFQTGYQAAIVDTLDYWQRLGLGVFNHDA